MRANRETPQEVNITRGNGAAPEDAPAEIVSLESRRRDEEALDEYAALEQATVLDDDDDEPGTTEEVPVIPVSAKMPRFARFRANRASVFDLWATTDEAGMDRTIVAATKEFAPVLEEEFHFSHPPNVR